MQVHILEKILSDAGIVVNGPNPWDIQVHDSRFYARVLRGKNLGLGESYIEGWWDCVRLDEFICRILRCRLDQKVIGGLKNALQLLPALFSNPQSKKRAGIVAKRHYNIDNDLFMSFLDSYNQYSCAYFNNTEELNRAQQSKLDLICKKIALGPADQVLDIGCGWGGFARYAAEHYGCTVTAVNISREQNRYAVDFCQGLPVHVLFCDYRDVRGLRQDRLHRYV